MLHVRKSVANHVGGEKAMKGRKFEALQWKIMKIKNAKREIHEKERVCEEKGGKVPEAKLGRCIRSKERGYWTSTMAWLQQLAARHDRGTIYNIDMQR